MVQIQISWLLQKPTDLDLHRLQSQGISGFSRTRFKFQLDHVYVENISETNLRKANGTVYLPKCINAVLNLYPTSQSPIFHILKRIIVNYMDVMLFILQ